ncbi:MULTISPECIES: hypothetical protein [unclassified Modestobacter]|uniref:hypothetical protein n=1 Tax=unclassified Modestobacter TaxID=2643866 RepID=UPI0022AB4309|nr:MULTISPECIES: hypothetical protein [unclassified Modestobacter]MCZ2824190.1 hypothetical protein [Modestobacter sp. VKM Ac-2981]MCZ2854282.1 hypothetical protein [Modestobacter sp. VKM Ac-2982]
MRRDGTVALLVAILTDVPALPGALCVGQAPRFDRDALDGETPADHAERLRQARWVCARCPVADQCPQRVWRVPRVG